MTWDSGAAAVASGTVLEAPRHAHYLLSQWLLGLPREVLARQAAGAGAGGGGGGGGLTGEDKYQAAVLGWSGTWLLTVVLGVELCKGRTSPPRDDSRTRLISHS
jgi:hypothetical protein